MLVCLTVWWLVARAQRLLHEAVLPNMDKPSAGISIPNLEVKHSFDNDV
jgi:hypothetical protein